jgi:hypothetical protein
LTSRGLNRRPGTQAFFAALGLFAGLGFSWEAIQVD